jgi:hypothetical protein
MYIQFASAIACLAHSTSLFGNFSFGAIVRMDFDASYIESIKDTKSVKLLGSSPLRKIV